MFLKNLNNAYQDYVLRLFNQSWECETLPSQWKTALLIPICKPSKVPTLVDSYRPISMLSCIGKLMERMVENRLDWVIERSEMLSETQTGFRKNRSTYDQLTSLDDEIHRALSQKHTCIVAYLDLAGAFDAVNHAMVIHKLAAAGITGRLLGWLQAYLQERTFKVLFEGEQSNARPITTGVPQGGILSPLLFNVLMSDFPQTEGVHCSIYADDIAIYASGPDPAIVQNLVQTHLRRI